MNKSKFYLMAWMAISAILLSTSCTQNASPTGDLPDVSFNQTVMPIIASGCTASGCHGSERTESFTLLSYDDVIKHGDVKAKDARGSKLYRIITTPTGGVMPPPPNPALTDNQVAKIYLWILQGAKNN